MNWIKKTIKELLGEETESLNPRTLPKDTKRVEVTVGDKLEIRISVSRFREMRFYLENAHSLDFADLTREDLIQMQQDIQEALDLTYAPDCPHGETGGHVCFYCRMDMNNEVSG